MSGAERTDYKGTWDSLATTRKGALFHVGGYGEGDRIWGDTEDQIELLRRTIGVGPDDIFLEIGCGVGRVGRMLAPFVKQWIGCDVSANMLEFARRRLLGLDNVRLQEISGYDLKPIPDASVDAVYTMVVFMHLDEWDRYNYVLEARRVLKPGGRFYCDNVNIADDGGWAVFEEVRTRHAPKERPAHASKCSTVPEIEAYLRRAGFADIRVATRPMWVYGWGRKPSV